MITSFKRTLALWPLMLIGGAGVAQAASSPHGVWIDHTGRGAVEITDCERGGLCGRIVWLKDAGNGDACNMQIIGGVKPVGGGKWDGGWIYDPERQEKYDVELTPIGERKLKVHGYAGMKLFGETMTWTRAPADLGTCRKPAAVEADATTRQQPAPADQSAGVSAAPQQGGQTMAEAPAASAPERKAEARAEPQPEREPAKLRTCSVSIRELGTFKFPC